MLIDSKCPNEPCHLYFCFPSFHPKNCREYSQCPPPLPPPFSLSPKTPQNIYLWSGEENGIRGCNKWFKPQYNLFFLSRRGPQKGALLPSRKQILCWVEGCSNPFIIIPYPQLSVSTCFGAGGGNGFSPLTRTWSLGHVCIQSVKRVFKRPLTCYLPCSKSFTSLQATYL